MLAVELLVGARVQNALRRQLVVVRQQEPCCSEYGFVKTLQNFENHYKNAAILLVKIVLCGSSFVSRNPDFGNTFSAVQYTQVRRVCRLGVMVCRLGCGVASVENALRGQFVVVRQKEPCTRGIVRV